MRKISPPPGFDPPTVQPVTSRYTDYTTRPIIISEYANISVPIVATILRTVEVDMHEDATQGKVAPLNVTTHVTQMTNSYILNLNCFVAVNFNMEAPQMVGRWPLSSRVRVSAQATRCGICSEINDTGKDFFPSPSGFSPYKYQSTISPHSYFFHIPINEYRLTN